MPYTSCVYFWPSWVFVGARASIQLGAHLWLRVSLCYGFSRCRARALGHVDVGPQHMGLVVAAPRLPSTGSVVLANRLHCSTACGLFPDQGSHPCLLPLGGELLITEPPGKSILDVLNERRCLILVNCGTCRANCH